MRKILISVMFLCLFSANLFSFDLFSSNKITKDYYTVEDHKFYFCEAGSGDNVIVFLHGLLANKEQWQQMIEYFANKGYRVIAPDLPGYGESKDYPKEAYVVKNQVKLLHILLKNKLDLEKVNIAGNSLGGMLAIEYASKYRNEVKTLALLGGPAGLGKWSDDIYKKFEKGLNPFIPENISEFYAEINLLFNKPPNIPQEVAAKMVSDYKTQKKRFEYLFNIFTVYMYNFAVSFKPGFRGPTLIAWGDNDKIFTVTDAVEAQKKIQGSELVILKNTGHLVMIESPVQTSRAYYKFLQKYN